MTPYISLIILILTLPIVMSLFTKTNVENKCLFISLLAIFLIMAFKSTSVGRDTLGYERMYNSFFNASWTNYDLFWTERGYETLEMIFTHVFKFDFYQFAAVVYAFICFSYYKFWKKYSYDYTLSLIIYICFGSFVFDLSGFRNALAMAIFLLAAPYAEEAGTKSIIKYFLLVLLAAQIHSSAYVGILFFFFIRYSFPKLFYAIAPIAVLVFRSTLAPLIKEISNKDLSMEVQAGGNLFFYIFILVLPVVFGVLWKNQQGGLSMEDDSGIDFYFDNISMQMRMVYFGILLLLLAGESTFNRVANFGLFYVTVMLPNSLIPLNGKSRSLLKVMFYTFFFWYFWEYKLSVNDLDFLPYIANWN